MILLSAAAGWYAVTAGHVEPLAGNRGIALPPVGGLIADPLVSYAVNIGLNLCAVLLMIFLNRSFGLLRSSSEMFAGMFMIAQAATPICFCQLNEGTFLLLGTLISVGTMYSAYNNPNATRRVFLAFFVLGLGALTQYGFVPYFIVFAIGCAQMRVFSLRTLLAMIVGILTPLWILWGFGVIHLGDFRFPEFDNVLSDIDNLELSQIVAAVGTTMVAGLILSLSNLIKVYGYNARSRAFNGLIITISTATGLLCVVNFMNLSFYIPLLNFCTAYHLGLYFRIREQQRGYIPAMILGALYVILYAWAMFIG